MHRTFRPRRFPSDFRPTAYPASRCRRCGSSGCRCTAQIGVAKAAYFPQLSLTGLVGYESTNATSLVNWQNTIASLGAGVTAPIFTGGRLRAGVEQAQAAYHSSLAQYEKTVLLSYQQVEDQLTALRYLETQAHLQQLAVADAERTEQIALPRFKGGVDSYLNVVTAQQSVLTNEQTATQIAGQREIDSVVLIKALGGGWTGVKHPGRLRTSTFVLAGF